MPSSNAQDARNRTAEIMAALKKGEPGDADKLMGDSESKGSSGILPIKFFKGKLSRDKKEKKGDGVIR